MFHGSKQKVIKSVINLLNPIALRKAKIVYNFGLPECNRVKDGKTKYVDVSIYMYLFLILC